MSSSPARPGAAEVISRRYGSVLGRQTVLKDDHFPGCQNMKLTPLIDGAPNFRQMAGTPVYGVAIPTVTGLRNVLDAIGGKTRRVLWHSLREEPLVYVNGTPFVLREIEKPFSNLELTGITRERVEQMEARLREDVLHEAQQYGGSVLVSKELDDGQVVDAWTPVESVQTPAEVYAGLQSEGYQLSYARIPITDEKAPKETDCDEIVRRCAAADETTAFVANCQMGRGRTTTAMVLAALVYQRLHPQLHVGSSVPPQGQGSESGDDALRRGEYAVIRSLIRVVENGKQAKETVDEVIDRCAHMQNLREAILAYRRGLMQEADEKRREAALQRGIQYLERYFILCAFAAYVHDPNFTAASSLTQQGSFNAWMSHRPELQSILRRLLWRNPMGALAQPSSHPPASAATHAPGDNGEAADAVVSGRAGAVLGASCILKEEPYPNVHSQALPVLHEKAPNFRQASPYPVFGVAMATVDGMKAVLQHAGAGKPCRITWCNLREEACIFICGTPYVLREATRPLANLLEYSGIDAERLELLETRLKGDVLQELERFGSVLVTRESADGQLFDVWLSANPADVNTPREVYTMLAAGHGDMRFLRIPITHNRPPKGRDLNMLANEIRNAPPDARYIFSCQAGHGRTTMGMISACVCLRAASHTHVDSLASASRDVSDAGHNLVVISRMLRLLPDGYAAKCDLDAVIDDCAAVVNLRDSIVRIDGSLLRHEGLVAVQKQLSHDKLQRDALEKGVESLDRYLVLFAFASWARQGFPLSFKTWRSSLPEVQQLRHFVRQNPLAALEYSAPLDGGHISTQVPDAQLVVAHRHGTVLAPWNILVQHFLTVSSENGATKPPRDEETLLDDEDGPCPESRLPPNFSRAESALFSKAMCFATPLASTLREFLDVELDVGPNGSGPDVLLTDIREEVVLYIDSIPFTLRETHSPVQSVMTVGIRGSAVLDLESRLKEDVLQEAKACGGRILVHRETQNSPDGDVQVVVKPQWIAAHEGNVAATADIVSQLKRDGFRVHYVRVPHARTRTASRIAVSDMDQLLTGIENVSAVAPNAVFAMLSHTGHGTAGYAMAVACSFISASRTDLSDAQMSQRRNSSQDLASSLSDGKSPTEHMVGETRNIASLIRVLRFGMSAKDIVDQVLDACHNACGAVEEGQRALLLIAASFMLGRQRARSEGRGDTQVGGGAFQRFFNDRAELGFLLGLVIRGH